jgi:hypothetical protein
MKDRTVLFDDIEIETEIEKAGEKEKKKSSAFLTYLQ